jgi:hypothetical protein
MTSIKTDPFVLGGSEFRQASKYLALLAVGALSVGTATATTELNVNIT